MLHLAGPTPLQAVASARARPAPSRRCALGHLRRRCWSCPHRQPPSQSLHRARVTSRIGRGQLAVRGLEGLRIAQLCEDFRAYVGLRSKTHHHHAVGHNSLQQQTHTRPCPYLVPAQTPLIQDAPDHAHWGRTHCPGWARRSKAGSQTTGACAIEARHRRGRSGSLAKRCVGRHRGLNPAVHAQRG